MRRLHLFSVLVGLTWGPSVFGAVLLNQEQALRQMFPDADSVTREASLLSPAQIAAVKDRLGGRWTQYPPNSEEKKGSETDSVVFFFANRDKARTGAATIESQPGKWGPTEFIIALDISGEVTNLAVMSYVGQHGRPIATRRFLSQFIGKKAKDKMEVGKDIDGVTGATIVSRGAAFAVKKAIALYEVVYLAGAESGN